MSRRRRIPTPDPLDTLAALEGLEVPGGCEDCSAFQTVRMTADRVAVVTVHHDESCPWLNGVTR